MEFASVESALERLRSGGMIILVDDEWRENEGDFAMAADKVTPEAINFMARYGRGLICLALDPRIVDRLALPLQAAENTSRYGTAFTVTVDAASGVTTGISAADRAHTIRVAVAENSRPEDLARPGHVFPLRARSGGVLVRSGQTEGIVDLCRLAGLAPAGVICEIMNDDGTMARLPDLERVSAAHAVPIVSIADVIAWRRRHEMLVEHLSSADFPARAGHFRIHYYRETVTGEGHVALCKGRPAPGAAPVGDPVLVRVHSECLTGDGFGSLRCDCGEQLQAALAMIERAGEGVLLYMRQEGRGIGLEKKLKAYHLQDEGLDTVEANHHLGLPEDLRDYGIGAQILSHLGVVRMRLLTNNPRKIKSISGFGLEIVERVPIEVGLSDENVRYLRTKRDKLGHLLENV
ncbi:MAG TPA: bifunctional 3,4-dihydroxy-2-butanone-4-phosphate synthase/GTP cyclohydrolase II [Planctomycetes bacterium]|nr:bifunctional 3,4-dihydroxy-2-butanone-4-phosphate synthase/GTP cyclohydrolase II [Planctomycetota bacterium]